MTWPPRTSAFPRSFTIQQPGTNWCNLRFHIYSLRRASVRNRMDSPRPRIVTQGELLFHFPPAHSPSPAASPRIFRSSDKPDTASVIFWITSKARKIQWRGTIRLLLFTQRAKIPQQQRFHIFRQGGRAQWNKTFPLGRSHGAGTENTEERDRRTHSVYHAFFVLVKRKVGQCQSVRKKYKTHQKTRVISRLLTNSLPR